MVIRKPSVDAARAAAGNSNSRAPSPPPAAAPTTATPTPAPAAASTTQGAATFVAAGQGAPVAHLQGVLADRRPVDGTKSALSTRLGYGEGVVTSSFAGRASPSPSAMVEAPSSEQRFLALLAKPTSAPDEAPAPRPERLGKMVLSQVGRVAEHLSPLEVATLLGAPGWADAIRDLGPPACAEGADGRPHWVLAAHLSTWMDGIAYAGASLDDVAKSFLAAKEDARMRFPYLDGALVQTLQKLYPFLPQWRASPAPTKVDDDWTNLGGAAVDPHKAKLDGALKQLSEVPLSMKLTSALADRFVAKQPFADVNVVMVQHMLGQANPLVDAMVRGGMDVSRAEYVGIPYQKNPAVKATLEQGHGVTVTVPEVGNIDDMWRVICAAVDRAVARHGDNKAPILILDDGGYASKYIADKYKGREHLFCVVEQTTRGLTEISKIPALTFPVTNVAGSYGKRFESAQVGDAVKMAVRRVLDAVTTTPTRKDVLIVGAGKVGEGVADSFAGDGARITVFDPFITPGRKKELEKKGYVVVTDKAAALDKKFLVVGCSGHRSIDMADFAKMSSPVFLASASSKRVEIDTLGLGELASEKDGQLRRILAAKVNEQETWHYWLKDGRIVTAMADGMPVNFQAVNSIAPELIDHTMSLMLLGAAQAVDAQQTGTQKGLVELDANLQFWLQAQMEGLSSTSTAAKDELALALGGQTFFGTRAQWQQVATSPATPPEVLHALFEKLAAEDPMDPLALSILSSKHELSDAHVDGVLDGHLLPHAARLLQNESLTEAQQDRVLGWLEQAFWAAAGRTTMPDGAAIDARAAQAVAVEQTADGWGYASVVDAVVDQSSAALFAHPRSPAYLRDAFAANAYAIAQDRLPSTVLRVQNPAWTTADLDAMSNDLAAAACGRAQSFGKDADYEYAVDLLEALRDHPSASEQLQQRAERTITMVRELAESRRKHVPLRGLAGWIESPLGTKMPPWTRPS